MKGLGENVAPPDIGRSTFPNYPRIANVVKVYDSGTAFGAQVDANADGLHPATVKRWVAGSMATLDPCWVRFVDNHDTNDGDVPATNGDYYGPARLCGMETSSSDQRAIYLVRRGQIPPDPDDPTVVGLSVALNAYLTSNTSISPTTQTNLSWTQFQKGGTGITLSGVTLTFAAVAWYEVDVTINYASSTVNLGQMAIASLTTGDVYRQNIDNNADAGQCATFKFATTTANEQFNIWINNTSGVNTIVAIGGSFIANPQTSTLSVSRLR
jgi:hypothetical protein